MASGSRSDAAASGWVSGTASRGGWSDEVASKGWPGRPGRKLAVCARESERAVSENPTVAERMDSTALFAFAEGSASEFGGGIEVPETAEMGSNRLPGLPGEPLGPRLEACAREREPDASGSPAFAESTDTTALFVFAEGSASDVGVRIEVPETAEMGSNPCRAAGQHGSSPQPCPPAENKGGGGSGGSEEGGLAHCPSRGRGACSFDGGFGRGGRGRSAKGAVVSDGGPGSLADWTRGEFPREEDQVERKFSTVNPAIPRRVEGSNRC